MYMKDWIKKLNSFLQLNERNILSHAGKISHEAAKTLAEKEYSKFQIKRIKAADKKKNDFDKFVKKISNQNLKKIPKKIQSKAMSANPKIRHTGKKQK